MGQLLTKLALKFHSCIRFVLSRDRMNIFHPKDITHSLSKWHKAIMRRNHLIVWIVWKKNKNNQIHYWGLFEYVDHVLLKTPARIKRLTNKPPLMEGADLPRIQDPDRILLSRGSKAFYAVRLYNCIKSLARQYLASAKSRQSWRYFGLIAEKHQR